MKNLSSSFISKSVSYFVLQGATHYPGQSLTRSTKGLVTGFSHKLVLFEILNQYLALVRDEARADPRSLIKTSSGTATPALWARASPRRAPEERFSSDKHTPHTSHRPVPRLNAHLSECGTTRAGAFVPELFVWDISACFSYPPDPPDATLSFTGTHARYRKSMKQPGRVKQRRHAAAHTVLFQVFFWVLLFWVWFFQVLHSKEAPATNRFKEPRSRVSGNPAAVWRSRDPAYLLITEPSCDWRPTLII